MKIQNQIIVCLVLAVIANSRILIDIYSEDAELRELSKQQANFERQFESIKQDLTQASTMFKSAESRPRRIEALQRTFERHRNILFQASKSLIPPLNLSRCDCEALLPNQKQLIINALNDARLSIGILQNSLKKASPCARTRQMQEDLLVQIFLADTIEAVLDSKCKKAALLSPTIWQTNLQAPNWIIGDQTLDDIVDDYYDRSVRYGNITNCPLQQPYFNGTVCINCTNQKPIFNLYTEQCTHCQPGFQYSSESKNCVEIGDKTAQKKICTQNQFYVEATNKCVDLIKCGKGTLLDKQTNTCRIKKCEPGQQINKETGQCEKINCGSDFYNSQTYQCEVYTICQDSFLNRQTNRCEAYLFCNPETQFLDKSINKCVPLAVCPTDHFLDRNTNQCIQRAKCNPTTQFYNQKVNSCEPRLKCTQAQFYISATNKCVPLKQCPNKFLNRRLNLCEEYRVCDKETILNRNTNECEKMKDCGNDKYFNRETFECEPFVACPPDMFLNRNNNHCQQFKICVNSYLDKSRNECVDWVKCQPGFILKKQKNECEKMVVCDNKFYNPNKNQCEDYTDCGNTFLNKQTNTCEEFKDCGNKFLNRQKNICEDILKCVNQFYNNQTNTCEPYKECTNFLDKNTNTCVDFVECPADKQIDKTTNTCVEKAVACYVDEVLNVDTGKCVKKPIIYKPAESLNNYAEGKTTLNQYIEHVNDGITKNPNAIVSTCSPSEPFSVITSCIDCKDGIFFLDTLSCDSCKQGFEYDTKSKTCRIRLYLNNLSTGRLELHGLSQDDFRRYESKIIAKNPNAIISTCPSESPYSVQGKKCINCPTDRPIFDIVKSECIQCRNGQSYKQSKHTCE